MNCNHLLDPNEVDGATLALRMMLLLERAEMHEEVAAEARAYQAAMKEKEQADAK